MTRLLLMLLTLAESDQAPAPEAAPAMTPYRVRLEVVAAEQDVPPAFAPDVIRGIQNTADRWLGSVLTLEITIVRAPSGIAAVLPQASEDSWDKFIRVTVTHRAIDAIEYDYSVSAWSTRTSLPRHSTRLDDQVLRAALNVFRPTASIGSKDRSEVDLEVRGIALVPQSSGWSLIRSPTAFEVVRLFEDGPPQWVPWSYLIVDTRAATQGWTRRARIVSVLRDPVTRRSRKPMRLIAIAARSSPDDMTTVRFLSRTDEQPLAGYEVVVRPLDKSSLQNAGSTDKRGDIEVSFPHALGDHAKSAGVIEVLLRSGQTTLARFPLLPGAPPRLEVPVTVDPLLPEIAGRILSLQEELIDVAARRRVLEARLQKATDTQNLEKVKSLVEQINQLPLRPVFQEQLEKLRAFAEKRSAELKQAKLGLDVRRLFLQGEALVERAVPQNPLEIRMTEAPIPEKPAEESPKP